MGLFSKMIDKVVFPKQGLSMFAKREGTVFHSATCDVCAKTFDWLETGVVYPVPLSRLRKKPDPALIDIGGWCGKCDRMVCQDEAEFIPFSIQGEDWWVAGCRQCQSPLGGKWNRDREKNKA